MVPVTVESYSSRKADERPLRFRFGGREYLVEEVVEQWYEPEGAYFKVRTTDGSVHVLRHDIQGDLWSLGTP